MIKNFNEWILENEASEPKDPQTYEEVKALLDKWGVKNYTINDDLTVDVKDNVNLENKLKESGFKHIPIRFKNVKGYFDIDDNGLKSLEGLAEGFTCIHFWCRYNSIENFKGLPKEFNVYSFKCNHNSLNSLEGFPKINNIGKLVLDLNDAVNTDTLGLLLKSMFKEGLTWKQSIIKHFYEIPDADWEQMTLEGQKLLPKEEFKKKWMGAISSKRLGL